MDTRVRVDRLDNDVMVPPNLRECHFEVYPQHQFAVSAVLWLVPSRRVKTDVCLWKIEAIVR